MLILLVKVFAAKNLGMALPVARSDVVPGLETACFCPGCACDKSRNRICFSKTAASFGFSMITCQSRSVLAAGAASAGFVNGVRFGKFVLLKLPLESQTAALSLTATLI